MKLLIAARGGHQTPTGWFLAILIVLALLYVGWRTGRLGKLRSGFAGLRLRSELKGIRIRPIALVPTALLVIVIILLVVNH